MCQIIGFPPTLTIGFGTDSVISFNRVPKPPASSITFTQIPLKLKSVHIGRHSAIEGTTALELYQLDYSRWSKKVATKVMKSQHSSWLEDNILRTLKPIDVFSLLKKRFKESYLTFFDPPKTWALPISAEILIYDQGGFIPLAPYLANFRTTTLPIRGESINIPSLVLASLTLRFWRGFVFQSYIETYIRLVKPCLVITTTDNDWRFYEISKRFPFLKTIFLQNGVRSNFDIVFGGLNRKISYHVDYMFVTCKPVGDKYLEYITGETVAVGTLKNNAVEIEENIIKDTVLFIAEWNPKPANNQPFLVKYSGEVISWEDFYSTEDQVLSFLDNWCFKNNKVLLICGRNESNAESEKLFFAERLKKCMWEYRMHAGIYGVYKLIDSAEIVISIGSTAGYESLARGKRTAIFSCRSTTTLSSGANFGWPAHFQENGLFWTNRIDNIEFERILGTLSSISDDDWKDILDPILPYIMEYDRHNSKLVCSLNEIVRNSKM
jgi:surface carbohydrate biosynthesis protein